MTGQTRDDINDVLAFLSLDTYGEHSRPDVIFLFGHYESLIAEHAASIWQRHKTAYILVSGKGRNNIPEGYETEAAYYRDVLIRAGIPRRNIICEYEATNTLENVMLGVPTIRETIGHVREIVLCAMSPLLKRAEATFRKHFPDIVVSTSAFPLPEGWKTKRRIIRCMREIDRIDEYGEKGDICFVNIPDDIRQKALRVCKALNGA